MTDVSRKIVLKNVRIRYPRLSEAVANRFSDDQSKKYFSAVFLFDKEDETNRTAVVKAMKEAYAEKFGEKAAAVMKKAQDNANTRGLQIDDNLDCYKINAKRREAAGAPCVFSRDKVRVTDPSKYPLGGDYVDAVLQAWCYDFNGNKGVSFELVGVRFREKGEPFPNQGINASADDFETLASDKGSTASSEDDDIFI